MSMKKSFAALVTASALVAVSNAHAFEFNFAQIANNYGEFGTASWDSSAAADPNNIIPDDVTLTVTATDLTTQTQTYNAYFDYDNSYNLTSTSSNVAGLGVCKVLTNSAQCSPSSDDNVTSDEVLQLAFDSEVTINNLFFRNGGHDDQFSNGAQVWVSIDNSSWTAYNLINDFDTPLSGTSFRFHSDPNNNATGYQFYIAGLSGEINDTPSVPTPAPLGLLGLVIAGLGLRQRFLRR